MSTTAYGWHTVADVKARFEQIQLQYEAIQGLLEPDDAESPLDMQFDLYRGVIDAIAGGFVQDPAAVCKAALGKD